MDVTGKIFSGGCRKKEKTGPAREPVRQPCLFADAESGHWGTKVCFLADSGSPRGHR
jgi:hypothetical protein